MSNKVENTSSGCGQKSGKSKGVQVICKVMVSLVVFVAILIISLKFLPYPYLWIAASVIGILIFLNKILCTGPLIKKLSLLLGTLIVVFSLLEVTAILLPPEIYDSAKRNKKNRELTETPKYNHQRPHILGYAPAPNQTVEVSVKWKDQLVYDVTYVIDEHSLRKTKEPEPATKDAIVIFGGSFTFGEGLDQHETLPTLVVDSCGQKFAAYNFGYHGYGPHQMLAGLREGYVEDRIKHAHTPRVVIYQAIPSHVHRAAGYASWGAGSPRFAISENGDVVQDGVFEFEHLSHLRSTESKGPFGMISKLNNQLMKSKLLKLTLYRPDPPKYERHFTAEENHLFCKIVSASADECKKRFPESEFHLIFWDKGAIGETSISNAPILLPELQNMPINIHLISDIIPTITEDPAGTYQMEHDHHPTVRANRIIADYIAREIVGKTHDE